MPITSTVDEPPMFTPEEITSVRSGGMQASAPPAQNPATPAKAKRHSRPAKVTAPSATTAHKDAAATAIIVPAAILRLHPSLGIDAAEFAASHTEVIDDMTDDLRRGAPAAARPLVVSDGMGGYLALDNVELAVAAGLCAARAPDLMMSVILTDTVDPARTVREQLSSSRGKSGWEQHAALEPIFAGHIVRQRLRELDLKIGWETRVSKVLKLGQLDPAILDAVDRFTIPVKEAGQIVDAWKEPARREQMTAVLADLRAGSNQPLDAKKCFKALLSAVRPEVVEPAWVEAGDGRRNYVAADGTVLATGLVLEGRWSAEGAPMSAAQWQAFAKGMLRTMDVR